MLTRYGRMGASSRLRSWQYVPELAQAGIVCTISPLFSDQLLQNKYRTGRYGLVALLRAYLQRIWQMIACRQYDLVWIEKEALPWLPAWLERLLLWRMPFALDYDDAVFHNYDCHRAGLLRRLFGQKLDALMRASTLVTCGNAYLAARASRAGAPQVAIVPTVVDLTRYFSKTTSTRTPCVVWIGSPSTARYLSILTKPLQTLAQTIPFTFRVIGAEIDIPGVQVECVSWSEATEVQAIAVGDIGVMPLFDSPWERGKCGYKLIQYMACHLPVVASPVGVNVDIVSHGENGYLAETENEWAEALKTLLINPELRAGMGKFGYKRVEQQYCLQRSFHDLAKMLHGAVAGQGRACNAIK